MRPAHYEAARRVDVILGARVDHAGRNDGVDDVLHHLPAKLFRGNLRAVLGGDDHCFDALRLAADVFHAHLTLAVGPQEVENALPADLGELPHQFVRHHDGQRHQLRSFVAGVPEHQPLVSSTAGIHTHGNVGRLRLDEVVDNASMADEPVTGIVVADVLDGAASDTLDVHVSIGGDLSGHDTGAGRYQNLARHTAGGVV